MVKDTESLKRKLIELYLESNVFRFNNDGQSNDEKLNGGAGFRLNFDNLFQNYKEEMVNIIVEAISVYIHGWPGRGVDTIVGIGNSGTILSIGGEVLASHLKKECEKLDSSDGTEKKELKLKNYNWAYVDKNGNVIGKINDGDKVCIIDEAGITHKSLFNGIGDLYKARDNLSFPVVLEGLDMLLVDEETGRYTREIISKRIHDKYNAEGAPPTEIIAMATPRDILTYLNSEHNYKKKIGDTENKILEEFIMSQDTKLKI